MRIATDAGRARLSERATNLPRGFGVRWPSGAFEAARRCGAATKRQRTAAVQDAGARPVARWLFVASLHLAALGNLAAAPAAPEINAVEPFVWKVGSTNKITLTGKELANVRGLWTSRHGLLESGKANAQVVEDGKQLKLSVATDPAEAAGPFALRVITDGGVSAPVMAMLDMLPELPVAGGRITGGPGRLAGHVRSVDGERFRVPLQRDQLLGIEVVAGRFGSRLDPVLRILDNDGRELLYVQDSPGAGVDCAMVFRVPRQGDYVLEIRDAQYGSGNDHRFLLRLGDATGGLVTPYVISADDIQLIRDAPDWSPDFLRHELASKPLATVTEPDRTRGGFATWRLHTVAGYRVVNFATIGGSKTSSSNAWKIPDNASLTASLGKPREVQSYRLQIDNLGPRRFTAMSRRLGGERDPVMRLKDASGKTVKTSHFFRHEAVLVHNFKEPGSHTLEVWDAAGQNGNFGGYHIRIEHDPANFELNTETDSLRIPAGGEGELNVTIERDGYDGPVKFELAHGPEGVELTDAVTKEKAKEGKFKLKLAASLTPGTTFPLKLSGRRGEGENAPKAPLYTSACWKKRLPDLYSPMFEFEDTVWITVLPPEEKKLAETTLSP
jgi:hypothetical protein